jgi:Outer membrane protein beta-barrel domain
MKNKLSLLIILSVLLCVLDSRAQSKKRGGGSKALKGGAFSVGLGIGFGSISQPGLSESIRLSKTNSSATTDEFKSGTEYIGFLTYRLSNNFTAIQLRPSIYSQSTTGTGPLGNYDYELSGFTAFPLIRFIALSNDFIDFYIQGGLGYAKIDGRITNDSRRASFTGDAFGTQVGMGADFCFFPEHCLGVEGSYRYLPIERNLVTSSSGGLPNGISQVGTDRELENLSFDDVSTQLSGVTGIISYTFNF